LEPGIVQLPVQKSTGASQKPIWINTLVSFEPFEKPVLGSAQIIVDGFG
jgi:hypothetical protein